MPVWSSLNADHVTCFYDRSIATAASSVPMATSHAHRSSSTKIAGDLHDLGSHDGLVCRHSHRRDSWLLYPYALADPSRTSRYALARSRFFGAVRLVAHVASPRGWKSLGCLRWRVLCHSHCVAVAHRWHVSNSLGLCRVSDRSSRHGRHHVGGKNVASKMSHPSVAGVLLPNGRVRRLVPVSHHFVSWVCHAGG